MAVSSRTLVEFILLGPTTDRRQLQDSPVLGDVWIAFAVNPGEPMDLLITPYKTCPAGPLAVLVARRLAALSVRRKKGEEAHVAYLQGLVVARLFFREVLRAIVPMTQWWHDRQVQKELQAYVDHPDALREKIATILAWAKARTEDTRARHAVACARLTALDRYVILAGLILWGGTQRRRTSAADPGLGGLVEKIKGPEAIEAELHDLFTGILGDTFPPEAQVWQISLNRQALPALERSVPAVKGDAARTLFNVRCDKITWAVVDSGIDGTHDALKDEHGRSRVIRAFDFRNIRKIISLDNLNPASAEFKETARELQAVQALKRPVSEEETTKILMDLAQDADNDRPIHWELVEKLIEAVSKLKKCQEKRDFPG